MYVVVGLGNPGRKYEHTRHNVGFDVVDVLAQRNNISLARLRCKAVVGEGIISGQRVALALPQTYMNLSGESVVQLVNWYKPERDQLIICFDDVDLPEGKLRFRPSGSAGTHNGMRSIVELLGYENFPRLRVGVGQRRPGYELADWVLGHYLPGEEQQTADAAYALAADAIIEYITNGIESAMCKYNTKKTKKPPEPAEGADA